MSGCALAEILFHVSSAVTILLKSPFLLLCSPHFSLFLLWAKSSWIIMTTYDLFQETKLCKTSGFRTSKLLNARELDGDLIACNRGKRNFKEEFWKIQASKPVVCLGKGYNTEAAVTLLLFVASSVRPLHVNNGLYFWLLLFSCIYVFTYAMIMRWWLLLVLHGKEVLK